MKKSEALTIKRNPDVDCKYRSYPVEVRNKLFRLREIIIECAEESENIYQMEETLKWGEPSFLVKNGSTIRIDWKSKSPDQYAMYFKCTSKLIPSFREVFGEIFNYEKNRALIFNMNETVPERELKQCINAALCYHKLKHLPKLNLDKE